MMRCLFVITLCISTVLALIYPNQFTTDLAVVDKEGELDIFTWHYDSIQNAEKLVYQNDEGNEITELRLYSQKKLLLVGNEKCFSEDLKESIPTPKARVSFAKDRVYVHRVGFIPGPVDPSVFDIPSACLESRIQGVALCNACLTIMDDVVSLGCNATAAEISKLCGDEFGVVCKKCLQDLCAGTCTIETCALDTCCAVEFCGGTTCPGLNKLPSNTDHKYPNISI